MKQTKKIVFWVGLCGSALLVALFLLGSNICYQNISCNRIADSIPDNNNLQIVFVLPVLFLFSLITYKMRDEIFHAWWSFARWWVPVIIVATLLLSSAGGGGGGMGGGGLASGMFEFAVLWLLYIILIIVSLVKIVRAYGRK